MGQHDGAGWGETVELKVISPEGEVRRWIVSKNGKETDLVKVIQKAQRVIKLTLGDSISQADSGP